MGWDGDPIFSERELYYIYTPRYWSLFNLDLRWCAAALLSSCLKRHDDFYMNIYSPLMALLGRPTWRLTAPVLACLLLVIAFFHFHALDAFRAEHIPSIPSIHQKPTIGKVMLMVGDYSDIYERALHTHQNHCDQHGYPLFVQRQSLVEGEIYWSKPAYLLSVLLRELGNPDNERLQWLMWVDYDTLILNPRVPVEVFLPNTEWDTELHFIVSHDFNGLNDGVFFIRVHAWSVDFLSALLAYRHFNPNTTLFWHEQSALVNLLEDPGFARHTQQVPWGWFNAYDAEALHRETEGVQRNYSVQPGDLLVHLAGVQSRTVVMSIWLNNIAERHDPLWEVEFEKTSRAGEVGTFWDELHRRKFDQIVAI